MFFQTLICRASYIGLMVLVMLSTIGADGANIQRADAQTTQDTSPVVVELFTSQGCSSCPPAETFLSDLAKRDDVIALEYHVDYWDYIGWKDPFANPLFTQRQRDYARRLGSRSVYTPQMVINGAEHTVGSRRGSVNGLIKDAHQQRQSQRQSPAVKVNLQTDHRGGLLAVLDGLPDRALDINLVSFEDQHITKVKRGENAGRELINSRVVRRLERLGQWRGGKTEMAIDPDLITGDGSVLLLQEPRGGPIVAADLWRF